MRQNSKPPVCRKGVLNAAQGGRHVHTNTRTGGEKVAHYADFSLDVGSAAASAGLVQEFKVRHDVIHSHGLHAVGYNGRIEVGGIEYRELPFWAHYSKGHGHSYRKNAQQNKYFG
jgi:hypothetical protein